MATLKTVRPNLVILPEDDRMPNSELAVAIYRQAVAGDDIEPFLH